ncbi:biotin--[acetyl-CoA-carboxylase] ligase [Labilibacter sediminis]|nr:biotin--[acetyl-CoA-carboxylase] ligase [Labilibacter sediminis]
MSAPHPFNIFWHSELPSTNIKLKELTREKDINEYTVICTHNQVAGKGQAGNFWESESHKNLTFSLLLKPSHIQIQDQFIISKAVALGILKVLEKFDKGFCIKWPNDIYHQNHKIGGILIENSICQNGISESIIGIGLNINQTKFISDAPNPISLKSITNQNHNLKDILSQILESILYYMKEITMGNTQTIDTLYLQRLYKRNGEHLFKDAHGLFRASVLNINEYGHLQLKRSNGDISSYAFKEVEFILNDSDNDN